MAKFELTAENYYSPEANQAYMSCSQYQDFLECEAAAMAKLYNRWQPPSNPAFMVGHYVHTFFEGKEAHQKFLDENFFTVYKTKKDKTGGYTATGKYADFEKADKMLDVAENDPTIKSFIEMQGQNEIFMTGEIFGMPWRIRLDKYIPEKKLIIDYKTCANIKETKYNPKTNKRETFIELYGYMMRAAVYTSIEKQTSKSDTFANFILICLSKQDPPDKEIVLCNDAQRFTYELEEIKENLPRIMELKNGYRKPKRCGFCDYCRATKVIQRIIPYYELMPEFAAEREDDYAFEIDTGTDIS